MANSKPAWESRIGRRLKLRDLHILSTVVQWGSMAKGATHLGMSQPAVSEAIASLEDAVRVRLLDRSPRGIEPTIYARALLKRGHVVFDELKQGIRDIEFLADPTTGEVRIGCPESMTAAFVPAIIDQLSRQYPQVVVHVVNAQTAEQGFRELRERSVDLMLGRVLRPVSDDDVNMEVLCEDAFFVVAGTRSRWVRRHKLTLAELMDEPWVLFPSELSDRVICCEGVARERFGAATGERDIVLVARAHATARDRALSHHDARVSVATERPAVVAQGAAGQFGYPASTHRHLYSE